METMLSALRNAEDLKIKELAVSAIGAIGEDLFSQTFWKQPEGSYRKKKKQVDVFFFIIVFYVLS